MKPGRKAALSLSRGRHSAHIARLIAVCCALELACAGAGLAQQAPLPTRDIPYVLNGTDHQRLDLFLPAAKQTGPLPVVVWIHGGGWQAGSKASCPARQLVALGYAVASVEYRFSQEAIYPAQIQDCKAAVRWLRAHVKEYDLDAARFGAWGESAGGHLVALLGTTGNIRDFDVGDNLEQSSAVQCVVDWYGPADFLHWGDVPDPRLDRPDSAVARLLGGTVAARHDLAQRASPVTFVTPRSVPFLIMHGDQDKIVPLQQSRELNEALQAAGVASTLITLPGAGHADRAFAAPESAKAIVAFLAQQLHPNANPEISPLRP